MAKIPEILEIEKERSDVNTRRVKGNVGKIDFNDREKVFRTVNSYLGMFVHYASYNLRQQIFQHSRFTDIAPYDSNMTKMDKSKLKFNRL